MGLVEAEELCQQFGGVSVGDVAEKLGDGATVDAAGVSRGRSLEPVVKQGVAAGLPQAVGMEGDDVAGASQGELFQGFLPLGKRK